jgi:hypothetical protein
LYLAFIELRANRGSPEQNICFWGFGVEFQELRRTGERTAVFLEAVTVFLEKNQSPQFQTAKHLRLIGLPQNHKLLTIMGRGPTRKSGAYCSKID